jgi:CBS domain-containing protein
VQAAHEPQDLSISVPRHVSDIMNANFLRVEPGTTLSQLERSFVEREISAVPVVDDDGELLGIITKSDLNRAEAYGRHLPDAVFRPGLDAVVWSEEDGPSSWLVATDVMSCQVETIEASVDPLEAARRMASLGIHHLLVTRGDEVVGMVSSLDLVAMLAKLRHPLRRLSSPPPRPSSRPGVG